MEADDEITNGHSQLGEKATIPTDDTMALVEKLVCQIYLPNSVSEVRWWVFFERNKLNQEGFLQPRQLCDKLLKRPSSGSSLE